ncbi:ArsR/SmtB family transcription factor [Sulfobacillus harzensis]|uniref:Winged helix-turn-helix transcriptional regulator n=1 Tax=Sulfobacillus harzensis TaxID=2729629 RepID=A0A7Y0L1D3_9FIRM|nr:winged helix-turn-helix domain-containing protein [Sulfobacillus harzensis]NMP21268.1 winged helix-turn-helix transcriptional regulator [Sulfobacillus harzensis]
MMVPNLAEVASLIGDESRAAMLLCLLGGKALPAAELARAARVTPQTASSHLAKLEAGGLVVHESYGRHRYYRLSNAEVGLALESLNAVAAPKPIRSLRESDQARALRYARTCYDHLAGKVGVALTDRMLESGLIQEDGRDFVVPTDGIRWFREFGLDFDALRRGRRHFARQCLDWSERRHHLAGALGAAMANRLVELNWVKRIPQGRAVVVTEIGRTGLERELRLTF